VESARERRRVVITAFLFQRISALKKLLANLKKKTIITICLRLNDCLKKLTKCAFSVFAILQFENVLDLAVTMGAKFSKTIFYILF
jgi:hypothetical protein